MFLHQGLLPWGWFSFPRVCGDVSTSEKQQASIPGFSPRMRGCFYRMRECFSQNLVFPAYAGMFPSSGLGTGMHCRFPRVCGDVSYPVRQNFRYQTFSPRMRGCFPYPAACTAHHKVFPAYAGMFPVVTGRLSKTYSFPAYAGMFLEHSSLKCC